MEGDRKMTARDLADAILVARHEHAQTTGRDPEYLVIHPEDWLGFVKAVRDEFLFNATVPDGASTIFGMKVLRTPDIPRGQARVTW